MQDRTTASNLLPPLGFVWKNSTSFTTAVAANDSLYGITPTGQIVAMDGATGSTRWQSVGTYVGTRLVRQNKRLMAYKVNEGLSFVDDLGTTAQERTVLSFPATASAAMSVPVIDDKQVYIAVNRGLYCAHQELGLQFSAILSDFMPHSAALAGPRSVVTVDGRGIPTRYDVGSDRFTRVWEGADHGIDGGQTERSFLIDGNSLFISVAPHLVAYDLSTGEIVWRRTNLPATAFASDGNTLYAGFHGAALWALNRQTGETLWQRQFIYDQGLSLEYTLAVSQDVLFYGGSLQTNPDGCILLTVQASTGRLLWISRSPSDQWVGGKPLLNGTTVYCTGGPATGAYAALSSAPRVSASNISITPKLLRGSASGFGTGTIGVSLPVSARVSIAAYRERQGIGTRIVDGASWSAGSHDASWTMSGAGGYTDDRQFGYLLVEVSEGGQNYVQTVPLPVNTLTDILWHWSRNSVEVMIYNKFANGYEDQTFRPDNRVSRAESSTIIANTLNLNAPSPGFQTRFTDISAHWARNFIMALEERNIVGGFQEPDGTYTFRPELNMTRAQEARILGRAYQIAPAPPGFKTKFTDITGHWAQADIEALEAAGYVNGFREGDGSFTYRPENNLTRAELCTVVVRIRRLTQ